MFLRKLQDLPQPRLQVESFDSKKAENREIDVALLRRSSGVEGEKLDEEEFVGTGEVVRIEKTEEVIVAMHCFCLYMCLLVFLSLYVFVCLLFFFNCLSAPARW